jgi:beta-lactam-binding protein with PASTA domain
MSHPPLGSEVQRGTVVRLIAAVPLCPVPIVWLDPLERARQKLRARGFHVRVVRRVNRVLDPGTVIDFRPSGEARLGGVVTIVVAQSPSSCDPSYPDVCIPPYPPALNCSDVPFTNIRVTGSDPHGFDG